MATPPLVTGLPEMAANNAASGKTSRLPASVTLAFSGEYARDGFHAKREQCIKKEEERGRTPPSFWHWCARHARRAENGDWLPCF
jgi:hypothetical protein